MCRGDGGEISQMIKTFRSIGLNESKQRSRGEIK